MLNFSRRILALEFFASFSVFGSNASISTNMFDPFRSRQAASPIVRKHFSSTSQQVCSHSCTFIYTRIEKIIIKKNWVYWMLIYLSLVSQSDCRDRLDSQLFCTFWLLSTKYIIVCKYKWLPDDSRWSVVRCLFLKKCVM